MSLELGIAAVGGLVSVIAIIGSLAQVTEGARLRRREAFYRDAASAANAFESDAFALRLIRRRALARLVARDLVPVRLARRSLGLALCVAILMVQAGRGLVIWMERGVAASTAATGGVEPFILLLFAAPFSLVVQHYVVVVLLELRDSRKRAASAFLDGSLADDPARDVQAVMAGRALDGSYPVRRLTALLLGSPLAIGEVIAVFEVGPLEPLTGLVVLASLTLVLAGVAWLDVGRRLNESPQ